MSLWLQASIQDLEFGDYEHFRVHILPRAPIPIPDCLRKELEFAEEHCLDKEKDKLFPIRFLWLMEAHEQSRFGLPPGEYSRYHPEKLMEVWEQASTDLQYRQECETNGVRFNFAKKALDLGEGWIYIGDRFVEDFLEVESTLGVELLFPDPPAKEGRPAFEKLKKVR